MDAVRQRMKARGFIIDKELPDGGGMGFVGGASRSMSRRKRSSAPRARSPMVTAGDRIQQRHDEHRASVAGRVERPAGSGGLGLRLVPLATEAAEAGIDMRHPPDDFASQTAGIKPDPDGGQFDRNATLLPRAKRSRALLPLAS